MRGHLLLALEQARPRAAISQDVEAAVGDGAVEIWQVHVFGPARNQIDKQRMHDIHRVLAAAQHTLGLAS